MLSKISITVDDDSKPCIKIDYKESDDVRDLLVKMFLENAGNDAPLLKLWYPPYQDGNGTVFIKND